MALVPIESNKEEIEIKKSRFIGLGYPISSVEEAREILSSIRKKYDDARHVCYAFVWGKNSTHMGMSDDGEPHGTAGMPMLEVVKGSGFENYLVAVVRYFGGTKLGTGGLVKAYTEITQLVTKNILVEEYIEKLEAFLTIPYTLYNQVKILFDEFSCSIIEENFGTDIDIKFSIALDFEKSFSEKLMDISKGSLFIKKI